MNSQLFPRKCVISEKKHRERNSFAVFGRSGGSRTHGLLDPNQARYQLRYTPIQHFIIRNLKRDVKVILPEKAA